MLSSNKLTGSHIIKSPKYNWGKYVPECHFLKAYRVIDDLTYSQSSDMMNIFQLALKECEMTKPET